VDALQAAHAWALKVGAGPLLRDVNALARRARLDLVDEGVAPASALPAAPPDPYGLSSREREVLELLVDGRTNREIGQLLFISEKTASVHVTHILDKMGAANRVEAASMATRLGLEPAESGVATVPERASAHGRYAFLFTDIVRSTALIEAIGDDAWTELRSWHDATLRRLFVAHGGQEVDHAGDGFFVVFPVVAAAVSCAIGVQRELAAHRHATGFAPAVRVGLHAGEAIRSGGAYTGRDVHLAARLLAIAEASAIVATVDVLAAAGLRPDATETVELPGIAGPVTIARLDWS
jgi:class 3 adenylate cyclase